MKIHLHWLKMFDGLYDAFSRHAASLWALGKGLLTHRSVALRAWSRWASNSRPTDSRGNLEPIEC